MITNASEQQIEQIKERKEWWLSQQTVTPSFQELLDVVREVQAKETDVIPIVFQVPSPRACYKLGELNMDQLTLQKVPGLKERMKNFKTDKTYDEAKAYAEETFWPIREQVWAAWAEGGMILGVEFDMDEFNLYKKFSRCAVHIVQYPGDIFVCSEWPEEVHFKGDNLHNESGPAVAFRDGFKVWVIDGFSVDEQLVMRPETQTIDQIDGEQNNDLRAMRLERFGQGRYLAETGAEVLDERENEIDGTHEAILRDKNGRVFLWPTCPSGKPCPPLRIPENITTCSGAQVWLAADLQGNVIGRT